MAENNERAQIFLRNASGLVKSAGFLDVFIYNLGLISVGIAISLAHFSVPSNYPGASLPLSEILAALFMVCIAWAFWTWSVAIPRSGGIYTFVSRGVSPALGFALSFVDTFAWLFYNALAATYLSVIGIGPALFSTGILTKNRTLVDLAFRFQSPVVQLVVGSSSIVFAGFILVRGMRSFFLLQKILFFVAITGTIVTIGVLAKTNPHDFHNAFEGAITPFAQDIVRQLHHAAKAQPLFSLRMTLLASVWPILSFVGSIFSVNIGGEIRNVKKSQATGMFGSIVLATVLMVGLSVSGDRVFGVEYQRNLGTLVGANASFPLPPYFSLLAALAAKSVWAALPICLGFFAWAFFWIPATLVYAARSLLAWSFDRAAPAAFGYVHPAWHTPVVAVAVVVVANLIFLALYLFTSFFGTLVLVLAAMLAWIPTMLGAILYPYRRRRLFEGSTISEYRIFRLPVMVVAGFLGLVAVITLSVLLWTDPVAAGHSLNSVLTIAAVFGLGLLWYLIVRGLRRRQGIRIDRAFEEIPIE